MASATGGHLEYHRQMAGSAGKALEDYLQRARVGLDRFVTQHPHLFLVRVAPPQVAARVDDWSDEIGFQTQVQGLTDVDEEDDQPYATTEIGWIIAPVVKREGGAFPDRIGVGRARNVDVVLRFANISKLHAQFRLGEPLTLVDVGSANGTRVNGEVLPARVPRAVAVGDRIELGGIELKLVDAATLFRMLG